MAGKKKSGSCSAIGAAERRQVQASLSCESPADYADGWLGALPSLESAAEIEPAVIEHIARVAGEFDDRHPAKQRLLKLVKVHKAKMK